MKFANWKTSLAGIATLLGAMANIANNGWKPSIEDIGLITGGFGLLFAKDHNVTGGSVKQPTEIKEVVT